MNFSALFGWTASPPEISGRRAVALLLSVFLGLTSAYALEPSTNPSIGTQANTNLRAGSSVNLNNLSKVAVQSGVTNCAERINQVSSFLGYTPQAGALLMVPLTQPDQSLVSLAMEVSSSANVAYVSATFAPHQSNGCGAEYDAVVYWPRACKLVSSQQFGEFKNIGTLKKGITVLDGGIATKVFLMPAGQGCVSIKKEIVL